MSVVIIGHVKADTQRFLDLLTSHKDVFERVSEDAKTQGVLHHQFLLGDGEVVIVDEWPTADAFKAFFEGNTEIPQLMALVDGQPPAFAVYEAVDSPDKF